MKTKKIKSFLLTVGFGLLIIGTIMFFVIPLLAGNSFEYSGFDAIFSGLKTFVSFDFNNSIYTLIFGLVCVTIICLLIWGIVLGVNKKKHNFIAFVFVAVSTIVIGIMLMTYTVAPVIFNKEEVVLSKAIISLEDNTLGKILSVLVIVFYHLSLIMLTLFAFFDIATSILGDSKEKVVVQTVKEQVLVSSPFDPLEGLEDRREREEKLFKECIETGEFTEYDELDLGKPLEGYDEEPIFESCIVEEEEKVFARRTFINVSHKQTILDK